MRERIIGNVAPLLVLGVGLAAWMATFIQHARGLWFAGDDFDFLLHRSISLGGERGLLAPHNEHWSTIPILLFRLNYEAFGLRHYLPYAILPIAGHVLVCALLFALLRFCGVGRWVAVLAALVGAFTAGAAGDENTLWDFQIGFVASCAFGLAALLVFVSGIWGSRGRMLGVLALILALMSSGIGVIMVFWVAVYLWFRDGARTALTIVAGPAAVYLGWYLAYGRGHTGAPSPDPAVAPLAALKGLGQVWSEASAMPHAGPAILVAMVAAVVVPRGRDLLFPLAASGLVTVGAAYALFGYTRSGFGVDAALASRYVYFGIIFCIPALAAGLQFLANSLEGRPRQVTVLAWIIGATAVVSIGSAQAAQSAADERVVVAPNKPRIVAAAQLVAAGAKFLRTRPMPLTNPEITTTSLASPSVRAALPRIHPGRRAELDVASNLQVDVRGTTFSFAPAAHYAWVNPPGGPARGTAGCVTRHLAGEGALDVSLGDQPLQVRLAVSGTGISTSLVSGKVQSAPTAWTVRPGEPVYVATTAHDVTLRIAVPAGDVTVCSG